MLPAPLTFNPSPDQADRILDALTDPDRSFNSIAAEHNTTAAQLTLWVHRPDIEALLDQRDALHARRTRSIAAAHLHRLPAVCTSILNEFNSHPRTAIPPGDSDAIEQRRRQCELARRTCALLLRFARFRPDSASLSPLERRPPSPARAGPPQSPHRAVSADQHSSPPPAPYTPAPSRPQTHTQTHKQPQHAAPINFPAPAATAQHTQSSPTPSSASAFDPCHVRLYSSTTPSTPSTPPTELTALIYDPNSPILIRPSRTPSPQAKRNTRNPAMLVSAAGLPSGP